MSLSWFFYCVCAMHLVMDFPIYLPCSRHGLASGTSLLSWFYWGILEASGCSNPGFSSAPASRWRLLQVFQPGYSSCMTPVTTSSGIPPWFSSHSIPLVFSFMVTYSCLPRWSGSSFCFYFPILISWFFFVTLLYPCSRSIVLCFYCLTLFVACPCWRFVVVLLLFLVDESGVGPMKKMSSTYCTILTLDFASVRSPVFWEGKHSGVGPFSRDSSPGPFSRDNFPGPFSRDIVRALISLFQDLRFSVT